MKRLLLPALLLSSITGCDHEVGGIDLPPGRTGITGITSNLRSVFAVSDSEVYVVGEGGTVATYDGTRLRRVEVPGVTENDFLWAVGASGSGEVVAVGGTPQETPLLVTLHDGAWRSAAGPQGVENFHAAQQVMSTLHFGNGIPPRVVLAGGVLEDGNLLGYATGYADGAFTPIGLPSTYAFLAGVTGFGARLYFSHVQGILNINAEATAIDLPGAPAEVSTPTLALADGRDTYMFGFAGDGTFHTSFNGTWSSLQTEFNWVLDLDGRTIDDLYAVGGAGTFLHFDGTTWTALDSGTTEHLRDVHVLPNGHVYVVGDNGTFFAYVP